MRSGRFESVIAIRAGGLGGRGGLCKMVAVARRRGQYSARHYADREVRPLTLASFTKVD